MEAGGIKSIEVNSISHKVKFSVFLNADGILLIDYLNKGKKRIYQTQRCFGSGKIRSFEVQIL